MIKNIEKAIFIYRLNTVLDKMIKKRNIGIKFPLTRVSNEGTFFDLTSDPVEAIKSDLMHLIFTPKGQRIRHPDFGTNLIAYIFSPNDSKTWSDIEMEIKDSVSKYIPNCKIQEMKTYNVEENNSIVVDIRFTVNDPLFSDTYSLITAI